MAAHGRHWPGSDFRISLAAALLVLGGLAGCRTQSADRPTPEVLAQVNGVAITAATGRVRLTERTGVDVRRSASAGRDADCRAPGRGRYAAGSARGSRLTTAATRDCEQRERQKRERVPAKRRAEWSTR